MADQDAALHFVVLELHRADLPEHLEDRGLRRFHIVRRTGETRGQRRVAVLIIGKINVDQSLQLAQRLDALIAATVVDHGDGQLRRERGKDRRQKLRRRDQIDRLRAVVNQTLKNRAQLVGGDGLPVLMQGDLGILTEFTSERTARKKHSARSEAAADRRLFPIVQHRLGCRQLRAHFAEAALPCRAVDAAAARAERAVFVAQHRITLFKRPKT